MKVSVNTVKQFTDVALSVDELVDRINRQLGGVDEVINLQERYKDALIVRVVSAEQHPNADRLRVCLVDDDGVRQGVPRDENGFVQVVCGAPNARADMYAVWLPPESTVPASYDEAELFTLSARELRGVLSQGMLAAGDELAINSDHDGIVEITNTDLPHHRGEFTLQPGLSFARVFGLDDTIIDIENKMFTHRPDLFGQMGVAREISAILGGVTAVDEGILDTRYENPEWYWHRPVFTPVAELDLTVSNEAPEKVPRLMAVALQNVTVAPSPLWLQIELVRFGSKPINNVVDITNYVMLMTAQPVHAYDYDKMRGKTLGARLARQGEKVTLLNHKTYDLHEDDIVIVDGEGPVGLAGIMGGGDSEVSNETTRIVLEIATFDMYAVRKTAMRHGIFTDALTRYNKGQSPLQNSRITKFLLDLFGDIAGATQASDVFDAPVNRWDGVDSIHGEIRVSASFINERLGSDLTADQIGNLLRRVNMASYVPGDDPATLLITAPYWRTDIELPEDIVEEVGRLYGYDKLPRELPRRSIHPAPHNAYRTLTQQLRDALSCAGASEVLTYSFVHERVMTSAQQDPEKAFRLSNALSPDLQYYRLSVTPSLLDKVHMNGRAGHDEFALFEIGKAHSKASIDKNDNLPAELLRVALTYAAKQPQHGAAYYQVKRLLEVALRDLGMELSYKPLPESASLALSAPFEPKRSARVIDVTSGQVIGVIGEYKAAVVKQFKLPAYSAGFELLTEALLIAQRHSSAVYKPLSRYPSAERDICFQVDAALPYADIAEAAASSELPDGVLVTQQPLDLYQAEGALVKNVTLRFTFVSHDATLTNDDVTAMTNAIVATTCEKTGAVVV